MTKIELNKNKKADLLKIAGDNGIKCNKSILKKDLVNLIFDSLKNKKEKQDFPEMDAENKKFENQPKNVDATPEYANSDNNALPNKYGDTKIIAMIRDPQWCYTYWEINETEIDEIKKFAGNNMKMLLRVYDITDIIFNGFNAHASFDIAINKHDSSWYIELPEKGRNYCIDIAASGSTEDFILIARSNPFMTPLDGIAPSSNQQPIFKKVGVAPQNSNQLSGMAETHISGQQVAPNSISNKNLSSEALQGNLSSDALQGNLSSFALSSEEVQANLSSFNLSSETLTQGLSSGELSSFALSSGELQTNLSSLSLSSSKLQTNLSSLNLSSGELQTNLSSFNLSSETLQTNLSSLSLSSSNLQTNLSSFNLSSEGLSSFSLSSDNLSSNSGRTNSNEIDFQINENDFNLNLNTELLIYGSVAPNTTLTLEGGGINLREDGSFSLRYAFPDGLYDIPVYAYNKDKNIGKMITIKIDKGTALKKG